MATILKLSLSSQTLSLGAMVLCFSGLLAGCDGINFSTARAAENANQDEDRKLIEVREGDIRPPLERDIQGLDLPVPGAIRPLGKAPEIQDIEREAFAQLRSDGVSPGSYSLQFSTVELDVLARTGAGRTGSGIFQALTPPQGQEGPRAPLNYALELQRLDALGVRVSPR